ncbi:uncharacterized protein RCC_03621 [Ramularia collo-cygni]|uniref:Zn(2)-C6 fungal-type domain-containing protein n=1 Tax=Ramularia collo-cygni TaxID=112498 RepID=A0A2D3UUL3_9PEZI|nr:uncharacterized protein RCC_03621 [Ramularia collo-cygni]CZT17785.1 uncharacterized protein RCC_03621 [Ramularia collo-cygni]
MLFLQSLCRLLAATLLAFGIAHADQQMPLGQHAAKKTITYTILSTRTRYAFRPHTATMMRPTPTLSAPWLAQLHKKQRKDNCDETACAMCKSSSQCDTTKSTCTECDAKPYCDC